jgi:hypothetical protein
MSCCSWFSSSTSSDAKDLIESPETLHSSLLGDDSRGEGRRRLETEVNAAQEAERGAQQELRQTQQELRKTQQELRKTQQELRKTQHEMVAMRQELQQTKEAEQNTQQELDQLKEERKWYQQQPTEPSGEAKQEAGAKARKETDALEEKPAAGPKEEEEEEEEEKQEEEGGKRNKKAAAAAKKKEEEKKAAAAAKKKEDKAAAAAKKEEDKAKGKAAFELTKEHVDKFSTDTRYFSYGDEQTFFNGLPLKRGDIRRSIEQECRENDNGMYAAEFEYVALEPARERELKDPASGKIRIKDKGHDGMTIKDFANLEIAISCSLKIVHIVVIRLYTGKLYKPWNDALRGMATSNEDPRKKEKLLNWATCVTVLYEAIIILSAATTPTTVYRGLSESWGMELPEAVFNPEKSKSGFAGGVELAFMSTTQNKQVERRADR